MGNCSGAKEAADVMGGIEVIHPHAAGLDLHKEEIWACAPGAGGKAHVRRFGTLTRDLQSLAAWLKSHGVDTAAMESTSVYWWPVVEALRDAGLDVLLVNAREVRSVKGRPKTDKLDCEWIRRLHAYGLLRGSFIPDSGTAALKNLWRHRLSQEKEAAQATQRMQKAMLMMNVRLDIAVTDVTGATGLRIIDAILSGERDPKALARLRDPRVSRTEAEVAAALDGNFKDDLVFVLGECLAQYRAAQERISRTDSFMAARLASMKAKTSAKDIPPPSKADKRSYAGTFTRERLFELLGADLTQIPGVGILTAVAFLVNAGSDMSHWADAGRFASWLGLSPNARDSGGKKGRGASKRTASALAHALRMAALTISRLDSWLGAYCRRLKARIGAPKAITATARKLAELMFEAVRGGAVKPLDAEAYERKHRERAVRSLERKAAAYGYQLTPTQTAAA